MDTPIGAIVVLMGPTGTGKSTFIKLLTNDHNIHIGHDLESQTFDVNTSLYFDTATGLSVMLVDTPGFDDSRDGITDTDTLRKIATFLQENGGRKFNGIIYLHRISDPRMGGQAKKNLKVFRELCGDGTFGNVRIVTTYWNRVDERLGNDRNTELANGVFKPFIHAGAKLVRHNRIVESARSIMSELIHKTPVSLKIQEELNAGRTLGDTSAGAVIIEEMKELQKKHEMDMEDLKKEIEEATNANNEKLRAEVAEERRKVGEIMARAEEDRKRLETTLMAQDTESRSDGKVRAVGEDLETERITATTRVQTSHSQKWTAEVIQEGSGTKSLRGMEAETTVTAGNAASLNEGDRDDEERPISHFLRDMVDMIRNYSRVGGEHLGTLGVICGAVIGLVVVSGVALWVLARLFFSLITVAAKRAIVNK